jgi:hypothetical protein
LRKSARCPIDKGVVDQARDHVGRGGPNEATGRTAQEGVCSRVQFRGDRPKAEARFPLDVDGRYGRSPAGGGPYAAMTRPPWRRPRGIDLRPCGPPFASGLRREVGWQHLRCSLSFAPVRVLRCQLVECDADAKHGSRGRRFPIVSQNAGQPTAVATERAIVVFIANEKMPLAGIFNGWYWARTSDPQLVDSEQRSHSFAQVRSDCMVERNLHDERTVDRTSANSERCHCCHAFCNQTERHG